MVRLEHGRVAETGTHDELLARGGAYARLLASQIDRHGGANGGAGDGDPAQTRGVD